MKNLSSGAKVTIEPKKVTIRLPQSELRVKTVFYYKNHKKEWDKVVVTAQHIQKLLEIINREPVLIPVVDYDPVNDTPGQYATPIIPQRKFELEKNETFLEKLLNKFRHHDQEKTGTTGVNTTNN